MKLNSISGLIFLVKDLDKTKEFYSALGFDVKTNSPDSLKAYLNWFWIEFVQQDKAQTEEFIKDAKAENKGAGLYVHVSVDNVDEFYKSVVSKGLKAAHEPRDWPWGRREFVLFDPDGYKLVFFQKI